MTSYNEGDRVRITFENGTITEGVVQREKFGARELFVDAHTRVYMTSLVVERSKVELIERAKPKLPTEPGSQIRFKGYKWTYKLSATGTWYEWGSDVAHSTAYLESRDWEEVEVVPKAALDKLRDNTAYDNGVRDFFKAVDK